MKLTRAQHDLLAGVFHGDFHCVEAYRPAQWLVANGLCIWTGTDRLGITEAGRALLSQEADRG